MSFSLVPVPHRRTTSTNLTRRSAQRRRRVGQTWVMRGVALGRHVSECGRDEDPLMRCGSLLMEISGPRCGRSLASWLVGAQGCVDRKAARCHPPEAVVTLYGRWRAAYSSDDGPC